MAEELAPQVQQWPEFIDTAYRKFVLPMVYHNLSTVPDASPPIEVLQTMRATAMRVTSEMLRRQAAFDWFHAHCVLPSKVEYAYFKGPAFAARFYPDPMQRFYRDIDILVPTRQRIDLLRRMRDQGCKAYHTPASARKIADLHTDAALAEFLFVTRDPHVVTPHGLLVELHGNLDTHTWLFDTDTLVRDAQQVSTLHHEIKVLHDAPHVAFICYHHTRHLWSKLNWLADLDAICADPRFDREAVLDYAHALKIDTTVRASLELHDLASSGRHPLDYDRTSPGIDLLRACTEGLVGDLALEHEMRKTQRLHSLSFDWQETPLSRWRLLWHRLHNIRPNHDDMQAFRRPGNLRFIVAFALRLARSASKALNRTSGQ